MRQIGSISMYYDFLDDRTVETIKSIVSESRDLRDFVTRFAEWIYYQELTSEVVYLAIALAWELRETDVIAKIAEKYGDNLIIRPITHPVTSRSGHLTIKQKIADAVDVAIATDPPKWILLSLLVVKAFAQILTPQGAESLHAANILLDNNTELSCFRPMLCHLNTRIMWQEGNLDEAIRDCREGLEIAKKNDDVY
ncbi:MAG: hypothetical protein ACXADC_17040, partial [Candidatus Thorarchaeota archaeon]